MSDSFMRGTRPAHRDSVLRTIGVNKAREVGHAAAAQGVATGAADLGAAVISRDLLMRGNVGRGGFGDPFCDDVSVICD